MLFISMRRCRKDKPTINTGNATADNVYVDEQKTYFNRQQNQGITILPTPLYTILYSR